MIAILLQNESKGLIKFSHIYCPHEDVAQACVDLARFLMLPDEDLNDDRWQIAQGNNRIVRGFFGKLVMEAGEEFDPIIRWSTNTTLMLLEYAKLQGRAESIQFVPELIEFARELRELLDNCQTDLDFRRRQEPSECEVAAQRFYDLAAAIRAKYQENGGPKYL